MFKAFVILVVLTPAAGCASYNLFKVACPSNKTVEVRVGVGESQDQVNSKVRAACGIKD